MCDILLIMKRKSSAPIRSAIRAAMYLAPIGFTWKVTGLATRERLRRAAWELNLKVITRTSKDGGSVFYITKSSKFSRKKGIPITKLLKQVASQYLPLSAMPIEEDADIELYHTNVEQAFEIVV